MTNLYEFFEAQCAVTPLRKAIVFNQDSLSYHALKIEVERLARGIQEVAPEENFIGVTTDRSIRQLIAVLAIHLAGKAYVPLDRSLPAHRIEQLIAASALKYYIPTQKTFGTNADEISPDLTPILDQEHQLESFDKKNSPKSSLAYLLFTSGSTGVPKGVLMGHQALVNLIDWQKGASSAGEGSHTLQFAPLSFDVSFQEIYATLSTGGTLYMIEDDERLDPFVLLDFIIENKINRLFLPFVALQYFAQECCRKERFPEHLTEIITAGETLKITPQIKTLMSNLPGAVLCNQYGPTESHVVSEFRLEGDPEQWAELPSIGSEIQGTEILLLTEDLVPVIQGDEGELCIAGIALAEGYIGQPELSREKFSIWQHPEKGPISIYRTGDIAKRGIDGNLSFLGRRDTQVKIRGYRIELNEIEIALSKIPGIEQAVVVAKESISGTKKLIAYLISNCTAELSDSQIKEQLKTQLPDYMIPSGIQWLSEFPKTSSGKVDRNSLPEMISARPILAVEYQAPSRESEKKIVEFWQQLLGIDSIGIHDNFFDLGGNSLLAQQSISFLNEWTEKRIPITAVYQSPSAKQLADILSQAAGPAPSSAPKPHQERPNHRDVAVIGMALRFPGCQSLEEFWDMLIQGKETTRFFQADELDPSLDLEQTQDPNYVAARGIIDRAEEFDASFFGIPPIVATLMDPQQRIFLEICREVLESSNALSASKREMTGVFAGSGNNSYYVNNIVHHPQEIAKIGSLQTMTLNEKDYIASRVAYQLDLQGPAISVYSACSTSLLAIATAVDHIRSGNCTLALAGGASITSPIQSGHLHQEGSIMSQDGHCRPFDAQGSGTVFSDGAGVVLLKDAKAAQRDGDQIFAIIKGTGINNDGSNKGSFSAPSANGQAKVISMALQDAGLQAEELSYVETHGTATPVGDPIEFEGLSMVFTKENSAAAKTQYCKIGSVKSNFGHLTAAAGVAGFIKTALSLYHKQIPPSLHFKEANPHIDFLNSPFIVNDRLSDWPKAAENCAGVSSFGIGGTNVHIVLQESPLKPAKGRRSTNNEAQLIAWSSKGEENQLAYAQKLLSYLRKHPHTFLGDLAYSLLSSRESFRYKNFLVANSVSELVSKLEAFTSPKKIDTVHKNLVFLFPGQGSQSPNMGGDLYRYEPIFKQAFDLCADIIQQKEPALDIRSFVYSYAPNASEKLDNTHHAQLSIFAFSYALSRLWNSWGVEASAFIGHSLGEIVAAHLAGVFSLEDALHFVSERGKLMAGVKKGKMLSIRAKTSYIENILPSSLSIAASNAPELMVVSGDVEDIDGFAKILRGLSIPCLELKSQHAFHSHQIDPIVRPLLKLLKSIQLQVPRKAIVSSVTGSWLKDEQALDPHYWARHARETVNFSDAVQFIEQEMKPAYLEIGLGTTLSTFVRQHASNQVHRIISGLAAHDDPQTEVGSIKNSLGKLWALGYPLSWSSIFAHKDLQFLSDIPTYAFSKKRYWLDAKPQTARREKAAEIEINQTAIIPEVNHQNPNDMNPIHSQTLRQTLEEITGLDLSSSDIQSSFIEIGLDSLLLTQVAICLQKEFNKPLSFRQLHDEYATIESLAAYLYAGSTSAAPGEPRIQNIEPLYTDHQQNSLDEAKEILKTPFGASPRIQKNSGPISLQQQHFLDSFIRRYASKTLKSKTYTEQNRARMADPRVVSGFSLALKEITYPLVVNRSQGSRLWDLDGNEYIDALNGFGSNLFGYQPEWLRSVLHEQLDKGYELGPQHPLAGEVCQLICEFTGFERAALCNTGSEAVLGAIRIARTATGRNLVVAFNGSYHGINDEVIVRGTPKLKSYPAAAGIPTEAVQNMLLLDYGTQESLAIIKKRAHEIAAVLVEPVQSRMPELQPIEFLKTLREITHQSKSLLIFDEIITGFRSHPQGAQGVFDIQADLGTYGKVIGGGLPIGVIAGRERYMDTLDGGQWDFHDQSIPEIGVTYFAGTFVRHPLALAAAKSSLLYLKQQGTDFQKSLNTKTNFLAEQINRIARFNNIPIHCAHFASLWKIKFSQDYPMYELLFALMREKGIHILDHFPCFLSAAHTQMDVEKIIEAFENSVQELLSAGLIPQDRMLQVNFPAADSQGVDEEMSELKSLITHTQPLPNARLGKDGDGNPAWFIPDPNNADGYLQLQF